MALRKERFWNVVLLDNEHLDGSYIHLKVKANTKADVLHTFLDYYEIVDVNLFNVKVI